MSLAFEYSNPHILDSLKLYRKKFFLNKRIFIIALAVFLSGFVYFNLQTITNAKKVLKESDESVIALNYQTNNVDIKKGIEINSSKKIANLKINNINPLVNDIKFQVEERSVFGKKYFNQFSIFTENRFLADTKYQLEIETTSFLGRIEKHMLTFNTQQAPSVVQASPFDGQENVADGYKLKIDFSNAINGLRDLSINEINNSISFDDYQLKDDQFIEATLKGLKQDSTYQIQVKDNLRLEDPVIKTISFSTPPTPSASSNLSGVIYPDQTININFSHIITNRDLSYFNTNFAGQLNWVSPQQVTITPSNITPGNNYYINVKGGLVSDLGGVSNEMSFNYFTNGEVRIAGASPTGNDVALGTPIIITFNQNIDHSSVESRLHIDGLEIASMGWISDSMIQINVNGMDFDRDYAVYLEPGIIPSFGLPNSTPLSWGFHTETKYVKLNVPLYRQQFNLSCEAAALRMAMAYRGVYVDDMTIVWQMGYNPRPRNTDNNTWDDPNLMFVGDINGVQNTTGWGTLAGPTAQAARNLGVSAQAFYGIDANFVAEQIWNGSPVVVWGYASAPAIDSWTTDGGQTINGYKGEHARTVVGVRGTPGNIQGFIVYDPAHGTVLNWSADQLNSQLWSFGAVSDQGVVIY